MKLLKKSRKSFLSVLAIIVLLTILSPLWIEWPMIQLLRFFFTEYSGEQAAAIVVLGRGPKHRAERVEGVFSLWSEQQNTATIFVSGMNDAVEITQILADGGLPHSNLQGERCSQSTIENAEFTSTLLSPKNIKTIILVSDRPHLLRASLVFESYGFAVIPYAVPLLEGKDFSYEKVIINLREYGGLIYAYFLKQFEQKSPLEIETAHTQSRAILEDWACRVILE